jgi:SHS2 domain-containing protein
MLAWLIWKIETSEFFRIAFLNYEDDAERIMYEAAVDVLLYTERSSYVLVQIFEEVIEYTKFEVLNVILFINHSQKRKSTNSL